MSATVERLIEITSTFVDARGHPHDNFVVTASTAVCQDAYIFGIDVDDYIVEIERRFGSIVWQIPWGRFTDQTSSFRGFGVVLFPFWFAFRVFRFPFYKGPLVPRPDPAGFPHRLELRHIAAVMDKGEWFEP